MLRHRWCHLTLCHCWVVLKGYLGQKYNSPGMGVMGMAGSTAITQEKLLTCHCPGTCPAGHPCRMERKGSSFLSPEGPGPSPLIAQQKKEITFRIYFLLIPETVQSIFSRPGCGMVFLWKNLSPIVSTSEATDLMEAAKPVHHLPMATTCAELCTLSWAQALPKTAHFISAATSEPNIKTKLNTQGKKKNNKTNQKITGKSLPCQHDDISP